MPKATVFLTVSYAVEVSEALMMRMLDSSDEGMGPFYPSATRDEAWEKLTRWMGVEKWRVSMLDGTADFPDDAADVTLLAVELDEVYEQ